MQLHSATRQALTIPALLCLSALLPACGGGGGPASGGPGGNSGGGPSNLANSLSSLGVDTTLSERRGQDGDDLMDYAPLGSRFIAESPSEVLLAGIPRPGAADADVLWLEDASTDQTNPLGGLARVEDADWAFESISTPHGYQSRRGFATGDFDADGREEVVAVRMDGAQLFLHKWEDTEGVAPMDAPADTLALVGNFPGLRSVSIAAGDFDGDAKDEVLIGVTTAGGATLRVMDDEDGAGFMEVPNSHKTLSPVTASDELSLVLATGNHDQDVGEEYVAILNEWVDFGSRTSSTLVDDAATGWAVLEQGPITGDGSIAVVANGRFADVDGDGLDELIYAGLRDIDASNCRTEYLGVAIDDRANGGAVLGAEAFDSIWQDCNGIGYVIEFPHLEHGDLDGDGRDELVLNQMILECDLEEGPAWRPKLDDQGFEMTVPEEAFFPTQNGTPWSRATGALAVGDVTADGLDDILVFNQSFNQEVRIFAPRLEAGGGHSLQDAGGIATAWDQPDLAGNPVVLTVDTDDDGITLVRTESEHELIFTEPIVLAVLAAPPTVAGIQQNYDDSTTTFGNTSFTGSATEASLTTEAAVSVGVKVNGGVITQSGFEVKATVRTAATVAMGNAYSLSQTIEYTTGPLEDTVIFTCIPMDRYTYRVVRHYDDQMTDALVTVDLPRTPVTLQVERSFYNDNILEGAPRIDDEVFEHRIGDIDSYPNRGDRNLLLQQNAGLTTDSLTVGQGGGSVGVTLEIEESSDFTTAVETGFSFAMETTAATVTAGFEVGASIGASLQTNMGSATTYSGTVGSIGADDYDDNLYSFGLFTYYRTDSFSGQRYQVLNYWVE